MISLENSTPIGSGVDLNVYPHPDDNALCIKIAKVDFKKDFVVQGLRDRFYQLLRLGRVEYFDYNFTDVR